VTAWWRAALQADLSQGDILADVPVGIVAAPPVRLHSKSFRGNETGWIKSDKPLDSKSRAELLASGFAVPVIVLGHDCELDKSATRVLVAPIQPIGSVHADHHASILEGKNWAQVALQDIPELGTCFADFRSMTAVDRRNINAARRVSSMTEEAVRLLWARLIGFFTRMQPP